MAAQELEPEIPDLNDSRLDPFRSLRTRTESGEEIPIGDGLRVLETLVRLEAPIVSVVTSRRDLDTVHALLGKSSSYSEVPIHLVTRSLASELVGYRHHGGVMTALSPRDDSKLSELGDRVVALSRLDKGENVGAVARSALGFGFTGLLFDPRGVSPYGRSAIRVSRGSCYGLAVRRAGHLGEELQRLGEAGYVRVGACLDGREDLDAQLSVLEGKPVCLVVGNEGEGIPRELAPCLDRRVRIPIDDRLDSLNVAAVSAILTHALKAERDRS